MKECVYVIDMGGTFLKGAVISNEKIMDEIITIPADSSKDFEHLKIQYQKMIDAFLSISNKYNLTSKALIISSPGPFDYYKGISLMQHKYQAIYQRNLKDLFQKEFKLDMDIIFENDVIAFLNGEIALAKKDDENVCGITLGTGLGFALKENGEVKRNELGSPQLILWNKPYLGGISEDYISARGLLKIYKEITNKEVNSSLEIYQLAKENNKEAIQTFKEFGIHIVNVLKPVLEEKKVTTLIIGGQVSKSSDLFINVLKENLNNVDIVISSSSDSTLIGLSKLHI